MIEDSGWAGRQTRWIETISEPLVAHQRMILAGTLVPVDVPLCRLWAVGEWSCLPHPGGQSIRAGYYTGPGRRFEMASANIGAILARRQRGDALRQEALVTALGNRHDPKT